MIKGNYVSIKNISKICRICLLESHAMKSLYAKIEEPELTETNTTTQWVEILNRITDSTFVNDDKYPSLICTTCLPMLLAAYKFKVQYDDSYAILQEYFSTLVKVEEDEDNLRDDLTPSNDNGRETSKQQIDKRESNLNIKIRLPKKRGRKKSQHSQKAEETACAQNSLVLHPCPICTEQFPAFELRQHAHTHKALKKYLNIPAHCKVDPSIRFYKIVNESSENKLSNVGNINNVIRLHKCGECGETLTASALRIHIHKHKNKAEYKCKECPRTFKKLNHLNTHSVQHLKERPFKCEQCGKGFVIKTNYDCHVLTHNTSQELPHECRYCLRRFSNPEHLHRHLVMHTENVSYSVKYKVCKCHNCLKTFKDKAELTLHRCVPVDKAVNTCYICKMCNKYFKNASGLYNHNRNTHKSKGVKVLCSVCGNYVTNIYNHMMRHTGEKPFECDLCSKRFVGKPQLRQHLLVHSGLKPFVCSICAKAFNNLYNLQVHERIHKGDRCHVCPFCNKGFLEKSYLKKHLSIHTKV